MEPVITGEIYRRALRQHQNQDLPQAEALYRQVLTTLPNHADALHTLGVVCLQLGRTAYAIF
jgi:protein O-GlcNAc transferase